jgi:DNA-binding MarR family transcriptional regulator
VLESSHRQVLESLDLTGSRITEIAQRAGLAKQTVGPLVRELAELGLVEIEPDPEDGRAKRVRFSDQGLRQMAVGLETIDDVVDRYTQVLGEQFMWHLQSSLLMFLECFEQRGAGSQPAVGAGAAGG